MWNSFVSTSRKIAALEHHHQQHFHAISDSSQYFLNVPAQLFAVSWEYIFQLIQDFQQKYNSFCRAHLSAHIYLACRAGYDPSWWVAGA
jgi:hypothetical protein